MPICTEELDKKILADIKSGFSDQSIANFYNVRLSAVRHIRLRHTRSHQSELDLVVNHLESMGYEYDGRIKGRWSSPNPQIQNLPKLDYAGLEARALAGLFTPNGQPTPAFWGFISMYVKKSGHAMLDILHDMEIYAPEQLKVALDIDSKIDHMTQEQRIALLRRVTNAVYAHAIKDPSKTSSDVSNCE